MFETLELEWATLEQRLRETAYLTKGLRINIEDERAEGHKAEFHYEGGIRDFVEYLNQNKDPVQDKIIYFESEGEEGSGRGGDAVELLLPGVHLLVRQQHQHPRGRLAPLGLPRRTYSHTQQVRARQG